VLSQSGASSDGNVVEINLIGCEGIAGVEVALRTQFSGQPLVSTVVQIPGTALRMKAEHFAEEVDQHPAVNRCVCRYMGFFFAQLQLFVACNRHHSLEQRCARRLLTAQDVSEGAKTVTVTQHRLAQMLGVSRQSVDRVLHSFEEANVVQLGRATVRIQDRQRLKQLSCRCYGLLRRELRGLLASA
jgi:CRP-like cAMP-binding protein